MPGITRWTEREQFHYNNILYRLIFISRAMLSPSNHSVSNAEFILVFAQKIKLQNVNYKCNSQNFLIAIRTKRKWKTNTIIMRMRKLLGRATMENSRWFPIRRYFFFFLLLFVTYFLLFLSQRATSFIYNRLATFLLSQTIWNLLNVLLISFPWRNIIIYGSPR